MSQNDQQTPRERIEAATLWYSKAREELRARMLAVQDQIRTITEAARPELIALVDQAANAKAELVALIDSNRGVFVKPKSIQWHGVKVGLQKGKGRVEWSGSEDDIIARIEKMLDDATAKQLIDVKKKLKKDDLRDMPADVLAKLGVQVKDVGDAVVVKATDDAVDKLIKGLATDSVLGDDLAERAL